MIYPQDHFPLQFLGGEVLFPKNLIIESIKFLVTLHFGENIITDNTPFLNTLIDIVIYGIRTALQRLRKG